MARPHNYFTDEQIEELRGSRYVRSVARNAVYFTEEFKRVYWRMYSVENLMPYEILRQLGIDYYLLGSARVRGLTQNLKLQFARRGEFCENREWGKEKQPIRQSPALRMERLRAENEYLKQELEFVKKIVAADGDGK